MSKIEELTEILANEIDSFEKGLLKLETLQQKIRNTKIKLEFQEIQHIKSEMIRELSLSKNAQREFLLSFEARIKNVNIYPKWAVITFIAMLLICFSALFYTYTIKENSKEIEKVAYKKGIEMYENYINSFFKQNPKSKKDFTKWKEKTK